MINNVSSRVATTALFALGMAASTLAGPVTLSFEKPKLDRWMYPFGATPGAEIQMRTFAAVQLDGFDDRDSECLLGFDLAAAGIPTGQGAENYQVNHVNVRLWTSTGDTFAYDASPDDYRSSLDPADPNYVPDGDAGKPVELFMAGYRNGFTVTTFEEGSPFGGPPVIPPAQGARNVYPVVQSGPTLADASNNVRDDFEAPALAVGQSAIEPGQLVPSNTEFAFDVDLCQLGAREYFAAAADAGRLNVLVSSLHAVPGPGNPPTYPMFYTKENPAGQALGYEAKLEVTVLVRPFSDADSSGTLDINDFITFQTLFAIGDPGADYDANCELNIDDFIAFQTYYAIGE